MLYRLDINAIEESPRRKEITPAKAGLIEKQIENFYTSHLSEIVSEDSLMLIGQERPRQEEADLLAIDRDGVLYIFELKRWQSEAENILQVMRYGQIFGRYSYSDLEDLAKRQQKITGSLKETHRQYFELGEDANDALPESKFNHDQVFVLVTNGLDEDTISAVKFWSEKGVSIKCAPYRIYKINDDLYIQFDTYNPNNEFLIEQYSGIFIANTNKTHLPEEWQAMLSDGKTGKAAAYYDRKGAVRNISKGDIVYLYHTGTGVVAKGKATSNYKKTDYYGDKDEEYYVPLEFEWALKESEWGKYAPVAREINRELGSSHRFRHTVFSINEKMMKAIDDIRTRKQAKSG